MSDNDAKWTEVRDNFAAACAKLARELGVHQMTIVINVDSFGSTDIHVTYSTGKKDHR